MSPVSKDNFTSSFPICMSFISFAYIIALSKTSSKVLNKSCKRVTLTLSSTSERKHSVTSKYVSCRFFVDAICQVEKAPFCASFAEFLSWIDVEIRP